MIIIFGIHSMFIIFYNLIKTIVVILDNDTFEHLNSKLYIEKYS